MALCCFVAIAGVGLALTSWQGTISGTVTKSFTVWDASQGGNELSAPYSLNASPVNASMQFHYWIENDGSLASHVVVNGEVPVNCTASWGLPTNIAVSARGEAVLTLNVTDSFSYSWTFALP